MKSLHTPLDPQALARLRIGETVRLSGSILTGRDAAHKRLWALLDAGQPLPLDLSGEALYYVGPCPAPPGRVIGSCGPTTSGRMDVYAPRLYDLGLLATIGKGQRSPEVVEAIRRNAGVYLAAVGGAGALLAGCVTASAVVAFPDLGPEAVYRLQVQDMPLVVAVDAQGGDLYREGPLGYRTGASDPRAAPPKDADTRNTD